MAKEQVKEHFENLGLTLTNLIVENISFPEQVEKAIDMRSSMGMLKNDMDTYVKYKSAEAIGDAAKNPGTAGMGTQLGAGMAIGEIVKDSLKSATRTSNEEKPKEEKFKFCPECGAKNPMNAKFCVECGKKMNVDKSVCPNCGEKVSEKSKFCSKCGTKLN